MPQNRPGPPPPPDGLQASGMALWESVIGDFDLEEHEEAVLKEACRTADLLDGLQATLEAEGLMSESSQGARVHPAAAELRQQRIAFARLLTALRVPTGEEDGRTQRRTGTRGVYGLRGVS